MRHMRNFCTVSGIEQIMQEENTTPEVSQSAFSLIELVIYMAIFSLLLTVLFSMFTSIFTVQMESQATSSVEQDGRFILSRLMYDMNRAQAIVAPANLGDEGSTLQLTIEGIDNSYNLDGDALVLTNNQGTNQLNSFNTKVSNLVFKRLGNLSGKHTIKISFTISSRLGQNAPYEQENFQTTVGLR